MAQEASIQKKYPPGLDIDSSGIRLVQLARTSVGSLRVIKLAIERFADDTQNKSKNFLVDALKDLIQTHKIKGKVFSSLSSTVARIKRIDLPNMPKNEIEGALRWEVQRTSSLNIDDLCLSYLILDELGGNYKDGIGILLAIAAKKDISEHINILQSVGLKPLAVEVSPLSIAAALNYTYQFEPQQTIIFLDFKPKASTFNIIANTEMVFSRRFYIRNSFLKKALHEEYIDFQELEKEKDKGSEDDISQGILSGLDNLILDIEHSFKYFSYELSRSKIISFDKILLCGDTSNLKGLASFLRGRLNSQVDVSNPFKDIEINQEVFQSVGNLEKTAPHFATAFGLALRGTE